MNNTISEKVIEEKIIKNEDIFSRGYSLKKVEIDGSFPEFIRKNKQKFLKWTI